MVLVERVVLNHSLRRVQYAQFSFFVSLFSLLLPITAARLHISTRTITSLILVGPAMPKDQSTDQNGIQMQQRHGSADPEKLNPLTFRSESFCFSTRPEYDQGSCGWLDDAQGSYTRNRRMILRRGRSEATTTFDDEIDVSKGTANYAATTPSRFQPNLNSRPSSALSSSLPIHDITSKITTTANSRPKSGALHAVDHCIVKRGVGAVEVIESIHIGSIAKDEQGAVSVLVSTSESDEFHQGLCKSFQL